MKRENIPNLIIIKPTARYRDEHTEKYIWRDKGGCRMEKEGELPLEPSITNGVKARRIQWLGHLKRMREERMCRKIIVGKMDIKLYSYL